MKHNKRNAYLRKLHKGVIGFEYLITLTVMSTSLYGVFGTFQSTLSKKGNEISDFIKGNGQNPLGTANNSPDNSPTNSGDDATSNNQDKENNNKDKDKDKNKNQTDRNYWIENDFSNFLKYTVHVQSTVKGTIWTEIILESLQKYCKDANINTVYVILVDDQETDLFDDGYVTHVFMNNGKVAKIVTPSTGPYYWFPDGMVKAVSINDLENYPDPEWSNK